MREAAAVGSLGLTLGLVLTHPRIGRARSFQVGPAAAVIAGVALMALLGYVHLSDAGDALDVLWRPILAIASIMVTTAAALRLGVIDGIAGRIFPRAEGSARRLFALVFATSAGTAAILSNDAAVLLLTPLVVTVVRAVYPQRQDLVVPFAFGVFMAGGVAPLVTANPMNLIVADYAGLDFNHYAVRMLPISLAGWITTYLVLARLFRARLEGATADPDVVRRAIPAPWTSPQRHGLALVLLVLGAYPVVNYLGGSVWLVASAGALASVALCFAHLRASPAKVVGRGVSWEILLFLFGVFVLALGLRNAGVVEWLTDLYTGAGPTVIGVTSAVGSALINNHSMALTNLLAIDEIAGSGQTEYLAALIGGDLGPRLLPMGSLAGLLWLAALRRVGVEVPLALFMGLGVAVTVPTLAISLLLLELT